MPLLLNRSDVAAVLSMPMAIAAMEEAFAALSQGKVTMPPRMSVPVPEHDGVLLTMPCLVPGERPSLAVKVVTVFYQNPQRYGKRTTMATIMLHDHVTGELQAIMDGEHLTAMRTGATCGLATRLLARSDAKSLTVFGSGPQAQTQAAGVCAVRAIERVTVVSTMAEQAAQFCAHMAKELGVPVALESDPNAAAQGADVICTATNSHTPLFDGNVVRPGTHINAIGSFRPETRELDAITVQRSSVYVDYLSAAKSGAGELIAASDAGWSWLNVVGVLGDVVTGAKPARRDDEEITLFKTVGVAVQDAIVAGLVYSQAIERGLGQQFDLD